MIRTTILTFNRDAALSLAALRCVRRRLPDAAVTVADDGHDPVTAEVASQMQALGARYVQTDFPRRGNLNGSSCVRGILATLLDGTADDDVAIKLDADTALRSDGPVRRMLAAGAEGFGSCCDGRIMCGLCYGFTGSALRRMLAVLDRLPIGGDDPEDIATGRLAMAAGVPLHIERPWSASRPEGRWAAYRWPTMPAVAKYDRLDVVTLGTLHMPRQQMDAAEFIRVFDELAARNVIGE